MVLFQELKFDYRNQNFCWNITSRLEIKKNINSEKSYTYFISLSSIFFVHFTIPDWQTLSIKS